MVNGKMVNDFKRFFYFSQYIPDGFCGVDRKRWHPNAQNLLRT